jgi:hypothetical protein
VNGSHGLSTSNLVAYYGFTDEEYTCPHGCQDGACMSIVPSLLNAAFGTLRHLLRF